MKILLFLALLFPGDITYVFPESVQITSIGPNGDGRVRGEGTISGFYFNKHGFSFVGRCDNLHKTNGSPKDAFPARWQAPTVLVILQRGYDQPKAECPVTVTLDK